MGDKSKIEWTERSARGAGTIIPNASATWNLVTGCTAPRFGQNFSKIILHPDRLDWPVKWKKPRRIFVNSLSDLFHENVPHGFINNVFGVMTQATHHTFQILTKRPERMRQFCVDWCRPPAGPPHILKHIWLGVSVEDQATADARIPLLIQTPAAVRFVSVEPLLAPIHLGFKDFEREWAEEIDRHHGFLDVDFDDPISGDPQAAYQQRYVLVETERRVQQLCSRGIGWVIVGGESGPQARPCDVEWIRSVIQQCRAAGVPCFVKQLGSRPTGTGRPWCDQHGFEDPKGGNMAEWPEDLRVREYPA